MVYVGKLTDKQRKKIVAEYVEGDGKVSQRQLSKKYSVSPTSISKILADEKTSIKFYDKKKENELSMLAFLDDRAGKAQELIDKILDTLPKDFEKASMRDKAGLLKILSETFGGKKGQDESAGAETSSGVTINIKDCSKDDT